MKINIKSDSKYDFLRSCLTAAAPACAAAFAFILFSIFPTASKLAVDRLGYKLMFSGKESSSALFVYFAIIAVGFCIAMLQFRYLSSKPQMNTLMSTGLSRSTLFKNRVSASCVVMFTSVLVPLTVTLLLNARYVGIEAYTLKTFLLYIVSAFAPMLIGFTVGTFTAVLAGTTAEAMASGTVLLFFPITLIYFCYLCCCVFLKGYFYTDYRYPIQQVYYLNPLNLIFENSEKLNQLSTVWGDRSAIFSKAFSEDPAYAKAAQTFSLSDFLPFLSWIAVCCIILFVAYSIHNKRKAEKTGFLRSSKVIAGIITSFFVLVSALIGIYIAEYILARFDNPYMTRYNDVYTTRMFIMAGIIIILALITLTVCLLIYYGSFRKIKKVLALSPLAILTLAVPLCCALGGFGFQYRVPPADSIESASITLPYGPGLGLFNSDSVVLGDFTSKSDINSITDIHRTLTGETDKQESKLICNYITISYKLKDGTYILRTYNYVSEYASLKTTSLFDSDKVEEYLYLQYGDKSSWKEQPSEPMQYYNVPPFYNPYESEPRELSYLRLENITVSLRPCDCFNKTDITSELDNESFDKLLQLYAKDIAAMNAHSYYTPDKPPLGAISLLEKTEHPDPLQNDNEQALYNTRELYVYPDMNNTVAYLDFLGVSDAFNKKADIIEINFYTCDKTMLFVQDRNHISHNELLPTLITEQTYSELGSPEYYSTDFFSPGSAAELAVKPFAAYTKKEDIDSIRNKLYPFYLTLGQSVSFAEVKYSDNKYALFIIKN